MAYGYPFRKRAPSYVSRAFELTRQFFYKWTVNWRFVPETTFLSRPFALGLLAAHIGLLLWFARTRWIKPSKKSPKKFLNMIRETPRDEEQIARRITPDFIMTTMLSATVIGMLCARSLHYQFYAYLAWATPFLLWKAGFHPVVQYALWGAQEWAWNVYPSTPMSSATVVGLLVVQVLGVWWGTRNEFEGVETFGRIDESEKEHAHAE
jgi:alpha-1,3-mannosyltransferase